MTLSIPASVSYPLKIRILFVLRHGKCHCCEYKIANQTVLERSISCYAYFSGKIIDFYKRVSHVLGTRRRENQTELKSQVYKDGNYFTALTSPLLECQSEMAKTTGKDTSVSRGFYGYL